MVSGAILTDIDRMISQLEGDSPALEIEPDHKRLLGDHKRPRRSGE